MSEREYIDTTTLARLRLAQDAIGQCLYTKDADAKRAWLALAKATERFEKRVHIHTEKDAKAEEDEQAE